MELAALSGTRSYPTGQNTNSFIIHKTYLVDCQVKFYDMRLCFDYPKPIRIL